MRVASVLLLIICGFVLLQGTPSAQASLYVGWGDALGGGMNNNDGCDRPVNELVGSFRMPDELSAIYSIEAIIDFCTLPFDLPAWWGGAGSESCQGAQLSASSDFTNGPWSADDYWGGQGVTSMTFEAGFRNNLVLARVVITTTIDPAQAPPAEEDVLYYAFKLVVDTTNNTCPDCDTNTCFVIQGLTLTGPEGDVILAGEYDYTDVFATWMGWSNGCPFIVPNQETSFGMLKAQFE